MGDIAWLVTRGAGRAYKSNVRLSYKEAINLLSEAGARNDDGSEVA